ncbi:MAG: PAS domain-containing protein [Rhodothermia bacterium]
MQLRDLIGQESISQQEELTEPFDPQLLSLESIVDPVINAMGDGVVAVDSSGAFIVFNPAARELLGRGPSDGPTSDWAEAYGTYMSDRRTLLAEEQMPLLRALKGEHVDNFPMFVRSPDRPEGFYIAVTAKPIRNAGGEIAGSVAVLRNISDQKRTEAELREAREELERRVVERTLSLARANRELNIEIEERKQAEEALKSSERQLRLMADSLPVIIAYVDARQRYLFNNASYNGWFGLEDDEIRGKPVWEVVGIERYQVIRPSIEQALSGRAVVTEIEVPHLKLGMRKIQMNLVPDRDDSGSVQGFYAVGLDITERQKAEAMERKHREELAHVSRVTTMGELTAALAHELNQPLTSIRSNAQAALRLMQTGRIDDDELEEILSDIISDNRRASEVIRRLRAMLRKRPMTLETLSLHEVVDETVTLVRNDSVMRGVAIDEETAPDLPPIRADRIQLQQVLLNLIMNGFEAMRDMPGPKVLTIRAHGTDRGDLCVCVSDQGPGFRDDTDLQALFQPFYSTKDEGMGMGLSISRSIIDAMGGRIWAENNTDQGATFHFTIPEAE